MTNERPAIPGLSAALLRGLAGGFAGAVLGHILVTACLRAGAESWLKGPYGPHFFDIALYLGLLYGGIACGLSLRPGITLVGAWGAFLGIALPMALFTRTARWGMEAGAPPTLAWYWLVLAAHSLGTWGTTLALGALLCPRRRWLGAVGAVLGSLAGYLSLSLFLRIVPSYAQGRWHPGSFVPSPLDLLSGLLIGAGLGAGVFLADSLGRKESPR
ncbi:MAG: hypothetical protein NTY77_00795 [Elusimicrobia bacterium]|nr:hypothetical protein [Elusimicrobiota bacterium]